MIYCEFCKKSNSVGNIPCSASESGSHRFVKKGTKRYRVRDIETGFIYRFIDKPGNPKYQIIEVIIN